MGALASAGNGIDFFIHEEIFIEHILDAITLNSPDLVAANSLPPLSWTSIVYFPSS